MAAGVGQISPDGDQRLRTPTVLLLCLWAWRGLLAALWRVLKSAAGLRGAVLWDWAWSLLLS